MSFCSQNEFRELTGAAERFSKNPTSPVALKRFCEKLKELQHRWTEFRSRYEDIVKTNQSLTLKYEEEHTKCKSYKSQLKRIKDNQENALKLKLVYENIKKLEKVMYSEVQIQTDEGRNDLVNKESLTAARETLDSIRSLVVKREGRLDENLKMMASLNDRISSLETQNFQLYILLRNRNHELENQEDQPRKEIEMDERPRSDFRFSLLNMPIEEESTDESTPKNLSLRTCSRSTKIDALSNTSTTVPSSLGRGDCKEVASLKKIRTELDRKQASLKEKIDRFNLKLGS